VENIDDPVVVKEGCLVFMLYLGCDKGEEFNGQRGLVVVISLGVTETQGLEE